MSGLVKEIKRKGKKLKKYLFLKNNFKTFTPIFVYQMGKVGSSSIYRSLETYYDGMVVQAHVFGKRSKNWDQLGLLKHYREGGKMQVVCIIREPIGRNVSAFFQNYETFTGTPYSPDAYSMDELQDLFINNYAHDTPLNWFDINIKENFDIDVFAKPFPDEGYTYFKKDRIEMILMKLTLSNDKKTELIREFTGINDFELNNTNVGSEKEYAATYAQFKKQLKLPESYLDKFCSSKLFRHFYSDEDIAKTRAKWKR